jgi:hypothetical protein
MTLWEWNVTPLVEGNHKLVLSIDIIVDENINKTVKVFDGIIHVYSNQTAWDKFWKFFKKEYKWLFGTLIIPVFLFLRKKRREKNDK